IICRKRGHPVWVSPLLCIHTRDRNCLRAPGSVCIGVELRRQQLCVSDSPYFRQAVVSPTASSAAEATSPPSSANLSWGIRSLGPQRLMTPMGERCRARMAAETPCTPCSSSPAAMLYPVPLICSSSASSSPVSVCVASVFPGSGAERAERTSLSGSHASIALPAEVAWSETWRPIQRTVIRLGGTTSSTYVSPSSLGTARLAVSPVS